MRKLMLFTIGFGAACLFCAYSWTCSGLILPAVLFAVLFATALVASRWVEKLLIPGILFLGVSLGLLWFQGYNDQYLSKAAALDGKLADVKAYCTDYSYQSQYGTAVEGFLYLDGKPCRAKFYVNGDIQMEPGDILSGGFEFRVTTQSGEHEATYHQGKGIFLLGYQRDDASLVKVAEKPYWAYPAVLRQKLISYIAEVFPADTMGFAKALLLGDRTDIDYHWNTVFKVSGIMHIIAVSGLHVTILFTLINLMCLKRRWLVALIGIPSLFLFAAVAGFTPSITRACIMQCLMILAMLLNREYDGHTELAFASLLMLIVNPLVITSVSFQLSIGCMIGIFLFQKRLYEWLCRMLRVERKKLISHPKRWFAASVSVTLSAISLTTPLSAYYFGAVSLVGVLTNLLVLWAVGLIFYGIILVCVLGWLYPAAAAMAANLISWLIRYVMSVSSALAELPLAAVYTRSIYIVAWLVFFYVLLSVFLLGKERKVGTFIICTALSLMLCVGASWLEPKTDDLRMTVLDVGQGQSIILQSDGKTYVVDCGGDYDSDAADLTAETLLSQGIDHIDGLILTHFDRDHAGGAMNLLSRIGTDAVYLPDAPDEGGIREALEDMLPDQLCFLNEDIRIQFDSTAITVFSAEIQDSDNEGSLAVLLHRDNCDILITGDRSGFGERLLLKTGLIPELDILVAGHHGSKNATCQEFLAATNPKIVAISVGKNSYGHPAAETLERLEQFGCVVYRTDFHGNLIFRR